MNPAPVRWLSAPAALVALSLPGCGHLVPATPAGTAHVSSTPAATGAPASGAAAAGTPGGRTHDGRTSGVASGTDVAAPQPTPPPRPPTPPPERVAADFVTAYLTYSWGEPPDAVRQRCRPFDTDAVDAALARPDARPRRALRAGEEESDEPHVIAVNAEDRADDHLDATVVAHVTVRRPGRPDGSVTAYVEVRVVLGPSAWAVAGVYQ